MPSAASTRKDTREKLAALIRTATVGAGLPAQAVYEYALGDFAGQSPVILVVSDGSNRQQFSLGSLKYRSQFRMQVLTFVAGADVSVTWTEQDVEDRLDLLEKKVADVISDNRGKENDPTLPWAYIELDQGVFTEVLPAVIGGKKYWMESALVIAKVNDA